MLTLLSPRLREVVLGRMSEGDRGEMVDRASRSIDCKENKR